MTLSHRLKCDACGGKSVDLSWVPDTSQRVQVNLKAKASNPSAIAAITARCQTRVMAAGPPSLVNLHDFPRARFNKNRLVVDDNILVFHVGNVFEGMKLYGIRQRRADVQFNARY